MLHLPPIVATFIFIIGIIGLFSFEGNDSPPASKALWIPSVWLFLTGSRPVSVWLGMARPFDTPEAYVEGSPIEQVVLMGLLVAALAVLISRADRVGPLLRDNTAVLLFFLFCAVSITWSEFPFVALKRWTKATGDLAVVLVILTELDPFSALRRLITRLGFILVPLSVLLIKYYPQLGRLMTNSWTNEFTGVTTNKNTLGVICMIYGLGFFWCLRHTYQSGEHPGRLRHLVAYSTILVMIGWLLHTCNSLTSICGLVMAGAFMWFAGRPSTRIVSVHLLVVVVLSFVLTALFSDVGKSLIEVLGRNQTLTGRTNIWGLVLSQHTNSVIGTGFESFWLGDRLELLRAATQGLGLNEAHNGYLEVYLNLGCVGVCFVALLLARGYLRVIAMLRRSPEMASLFLGWFMATLFYSLTEAAFRMMSPSWIFLVMVMVATSPAVAAEPETEMETEVHDPAGLAPFQPATADTLPGISG